MVLSFYSNDHSPIHVHCKYQGEESKAEIIFEDGKFKEIKIQDVKGKTPLETQNEKRFRKFFEYYREDIVNKWINFFVYNKEIKTEIITKKIH